MKMDKYERNVAAELVETYIASAPVEHKGDKIRVKLECGMIVSCKNDQESIRSMASKLRKGFRTKNPHMPRGPKPATPVKRVIENFIKDGEMDNALNICELNDIDPSSFGIVSL